MRLDDRYLKGIIGIIIIFCIGLVLFFIFSEPYGDGLERTMEEGEVGETEPSHSAPLDYGDNYGMALLMGFVGFLVVLCCVLIFARIMRKKNETR